MRLDVIDDYLYLDLESGVMVLLKESGKIF